MLNIEQHTMEEFPSTSQKQSGGVKITKPRGVVRYSFGQVMKTLVSGHVRKNNTSFFSILRSDNNSVSQTSLE
jgi:hypothetical protein